MDLEEKLYENLIVVDVGANLTNVKFNRNLDGVINRAKDAGVQKIIVKGTTIKSYKEALRLSRMYPGTIYSAAGIHPHCAASMDSDEIWDDLLKIASAPECVAIGECGLNYSKEYSDPQVQRSVFKKMIELACDVGKPLLVQDRGGAFQDIILALSEAGNRLPPVIISGFMGTLEEGKTYIDRGYYLELTGYLSKAKSEEGVRKLLTDGVLPLNRLLIGSDAPFMYPNIRSSALPPEVKQAMTKRSVTYVERYCAYQRNEPCSLPAVVEIIAGFLQMKPEDVALTTTFNAFMLFALDQ